MAAMCVSFSLSGPLLNYSFELLCYSFKSRLCVAPAVLIVFGFVSVAFFTSSSLRINAVVGCLRSIQFAFLKSRHLFRVIADHNHTLISCSYLRTILV